MKKDSQFIHTYKSHCGYRQPVITTALKLDRVEDGTVRGLGIGFSYCSVADQPNKKIGRMIAMSRAKEAVEVHNGIKPKRVSEHDEPRAFHVHQLYIRLPLESPNILECLPLPEDSNVYARLILALANVEKFGQL